MIGVTVINLIAYLISRSSFSRTAMYIVIIDPMIGVPASIFLAHTGQTEHGIGGGMWMAIGTLMASLTLPIRHTVLIIIATVFVLAFVAFNVDSSYMTVTLSEFLTVIAISCLALVSTQMRLESDRELQLERAKVLQSSKLASLGEMASGVAHELNSPLGAIVLTSEMVEDMLTGVKTDDPQTIQDIATEVKMIGSIAERMSKIISGLKSFARDAENEALVESSSQVWVQDSLDLCRQRFSNAGIKVEVASENLDTVCAVQTIQISQTLVNLLNNAFDAIQDKQEKWIRIDAVKTKSHFELRVTDSGTGIPKATVERIFEPFYTTKDYSHGTGLGLSISKGIAQAHGGDLVYDATSANTRFIIRLPLVASKAVTQLAS